MTVALDFVYVFYYEPRFTRLLISDMGGLDSGAYLNRALFTEYSYVKKHSCSLLPWICDRAFNDPYFNTVTVGSRFGDYKASTDSFCYYVCSCSAILNQQLHVHSVEIQLTSQRHDTK
jgi:hypothetical protein